MVFTASGLYTPRRQVHGLKIAQDVHKGKTCM
jgi:hypothetical protein